jgi:hypothetical protein
MDAGSEAMFVFFDVEVDGAADIEVMYSVFRLNQYWQ